jgi:hypothetical protein
MHAGITGITELAVKSGLTKGLPSGQRDQNSNRPYEDKFNRPRLMLERFLLVRGLKSAARCSGRHPRRGDFLSMTEEAMGITLIVFVLIILLFGFHLIGRDPSPVQQANKRRRGKIRAGKSRSSKA